MTLSMDLLIDIGNTNLKWTLGASGSLEAMRAVRHHGGLPIDLHAAWEQLTPPRQILVSNVGGAEMAKALERVCRSYWDRAPLFVTTEPKACGVTIAYEHPERLGVDRWLALIAAHRICRGPVLVVDAGTAITYDLLLGDGSHLGGLITAGIEMMRDRLIAGTRIPRIEPMESADTWATDTGTAIAVGSIQAPAALAERLFHRLTEQVGKTPQCILSGGDAERLIPALRLPTQHRPDLVLQGLALLS
ncbi:type III pantothenate kinase [Candidatus Thiosymbion oneisti]|uniref:type III pantothenate kinase n=2 Tax=Candidatus Thiosymbion oneisti TaxID=589554 RepID=UPI00312CA01A